MSVCFQLKEVVDGYFDNHPHMSINALALKSGVGATTLRRLIGGNIKNDPAPHTVLNIVSAVTNEKKLGRLVNIIEGPISDYLNDAFGNFLGEIETHYKLDLNDLLADEISYFIYRLAANRVGTDRVDIIHLFGKLGEEKLLNLKKKGFVYEDSGKVHATEKNYSLNVEVAASHIPALVKFYKPHLVSEGQNLFYTMSESLNEEGIQKVKEIQKEAIKKIYNIMKSPFYEGTIPFFTLDMCDTMTMGKANEVLQ